MPKSRDRAKRSHTLRTAEGSDKWGRRTFIITVVMLVVAVGQWLFPRQPSVTQPQTWVLNPVTATDSLRIQVHDVATVTDTNIRVATASATNTTINTILE